MSLDRRARSSRTALWVLSVVSVLLVTTVNRAAGSLFPEWPGLPESCVASFVICLAVYLGIGPERPFAGPVPKTRWSRLLRIAGTWLAIWIAASAIEAARVGRWERYRLADTPAQLVGFLVLGPAQEEMLFRGAIFELARRSAPSGPRSFAILISTLLFSAHHFQLHGYRLTPMAMAQMGFAIPMGLVFAALRDESDSLWPGFAVHALTNLPGAFGS